MHISFILSSLWLSGGVRVIVEYSNRVIARGHRVTLVIPGGTLDPALEGELDAKLEIRQSDVLCQPGRSLWENARLSWSLAKNVPYSDVVISTHTPTTVAGFLAAYILRRGKLVWLYQDYREMFEGRLVEDWLLRNALHWHKCALVVSDYSRQELSSYSPGDIRIVGEGISHSEIFKPSSLWPCSKGDSDKVILFLGDMRPRKGLFDFLAAAKMVYTNVKNVKLLIVSKEHCDIPDTGQVPFEYIYRPSRLELAKLYATCDLFVSASWHESFGLPPLEAMACGAPVVLTDSGGVREYARHEENCLMVSPHDPEALAAAMICVLTNSVLAKRLRMNGPPTAACFTWDRSVDRFEAALLACLK